MSTIALAQFRKQVGPDLPLIGAGGVESVETAFAKIAAGANLVQFYTALVYRGARSSGGSPLRLSRLLDRRGLASIADAVGIETNNGGRTP